MIVPFEVNIGHNSRMECTRESVLAVFSNLYLFAILVIFVIWYFINNHSDLAVHLHGHQKRA